MLRQLIVRPFLARTATPTVTPRQLAARALSSSSAVSRGNGGGGGRGLSQRQRRGQSQAVAARPSGPAGLFDEMFNNDPFFSDPFFRPFLSTRGGFGGGMAEPGIAPMSLDISETDTHFVVKAELPGIKKEDVKITLDDGMLTIQAERRTEETGEDKEHKLHYSDFSYGKLSRSMRLPDAADPNNVEAELKDGVLKVTIKRAEHAQPTSIDIK